MCKTKMKRVFIIAIITLFTFGCFEKSKKEQSYIGLREKLITNDKNEAFDNGISLTEEELILESKLVALRELFERNIKINKLKFYNEPFHNFKDFISATTLFEIIKSMPKGGLLHTHSGGVTNVEWIIEKAQEIPDCFVFCESENKNILYGQLGVYKNKEAPLGFVNLKDKIESDPNFKTELYKLLVLKRSELRNDENYWIEFEKRFMRIIPLISYRPFFKEYYKKSFLDLISDNVNHIEIRFIFGNLFDFENDIYPIDTMVDDLKEVVADIQKTVPYFSLNLIYTSFKFLGVQEINHQLNEAFRLKKKYPDLISGFDLVAEEDRGNTIDFYRNSWEKLDSLENSTGLKLPLFLHAGESNSVKNKNLYEAVLLNSKRIGHGLNLVLYPKLLNEVKKNNILVEVNPLSNQILGYVSDLRNHPARILLNNGVQCSISSDDPGVFGYEGLSYDFFMVFVAWELDLKTIKKLVFNSVEYSSMENERKTMALQILESDWKEFVSKANLILDKKNISN